MEEEGGKKRKGKKAQDQSVIVFCPAAWRGNADVGGVFTENQDPGKEKKKSASYSYKNNLISSSRKARKLENTPRMCPGAPCHRLCGYLCYFLTPFQSPHRCALRAEMRRRRRPSSRCSARTSLTPPPTNHSSERYPGRHSGGGTNLLKAASRYTKV